MDVITSLEEIDFSLNESGVALGNFDGVHRGHQVLIDKLIKTCKKNNLISVVFTFANHPRHFTKNNNALKKITPIDKKIKIINELGVDYLVVIPFNEEIRCLMPKDFITKILIEKLNAKYVFCGFNYRFGYKAQGDTNLLEEYTKLNKFKLYVLEPIKKDNTIISSTKIRELIKLGKVEEANVLLGRNYSLVGEVIYGRGIGKKFIFPTANIFVEDTILVPNNGVYVTKSIIDNKSYYSITNIGYNPTIADNNKISVETNLIDFSEDIYGKIIKVEFLKKLREEIKFNSIEALKRQINTDLNAVKKYYNVK